MSSHAERLAKRMRETEGRETQSDALERFVVGEISRRYRSPPRWAPHRCMYSELRAISEFPYLMQGWAPDGGLPLHRRNDAVFPQWFGRKLLDLPPVVTLGRMSESFDKPCAVAFLRKGFKAMVAYDSSSSLPERGVVLRARFPKREISIRSFVEWLREVVEVHPPRSAGDP